jgi:hypothetical protein
VLPSYTGVEQVVNASVPNPAFTVSPLTSPWKVRCASVISVPSPLSVFVRLVTVAPLMVEVP